MRSAVLLFGSLLALNAAATLPPATPAAKAAAAETAAKSAWADKVGAYQLCKSQDRIAETYRKDLKASGKTAPPPAGTPAPCVDPGPYATPVAQKPLEASGAHSPTETAKGPPSTIAPAADAMPTKK